jgi:hypothetical protein
VPLHRISLALNLGYAAPSFPKIEAWLAIAAADRALRSHAGSLASIRRKVDAADCRGCAGRSSSRSPPQCSFEIESAAELAGSAMVEPMRVLVGQLS